MFSKKTQEFTESEICKTRSVPQLVLCVRYFAAQAAAHALQLEIQEVDLQISAAGRGGIVIQWLNSWDIYIYIVNSII
jgi:hypothetical protein